MLIIRLLHLVRKFAMVVLISTIITPDLSIAKIRNRDRTYCPEYYYSYLDSMAINLEPGSGRTYIYSSAGSTFLYGSTLTHAEEGWMGFHWGEIKLWDDWFVTVDGELMDRAKARVVVKPHVLTFYWESNIKLEVMPYGVDRDDLRFILRGIQDDSESTLFVIFPSNVIAQELQSESRLIYFPVAIPSGVDTVGVAIGSRNNFLVHQLVKTGTSYSIFENHLERKQIWGASFNGKGFDLVITYGENPVQMAERLTEIFYDKSKSALKSITKADNYRRVRWLLRAINDSYFRCENEQINLAFNWAKISLASLFYIEDYSTRLWAGLPWFNDSWGRDTFISLPGACLTVRNPDQAKSLLKLFAKWQNKDPESSDWGKIPNRVRGGEINFNTADGTPSFVKAVYEYGIYSYQNYKFKTWKNFLEPDKGAVWLANEGTIKHRIDENGFIKHGDAETWMDAAGSNGAWSPRGDRAIEVQVLWLTQLEASLKMMEIIGLENLSDNSNIRWQNIANKLRKNIPEFYLREDGLGLYDHLNPDGSKDEKIRPNQLFALTVPLTPLFSDSISHNILKTVRDNCVYPWGVASLAQSDVDFHPYHQTYHYPKDAAYHNGIVWTWLSGAYKSAAHDKGWSITMNELDQIINQGAVGTLSENLDAIPRDGHSVPRNSGTVSQAWSLAELMRVWYQDYIGLKYRIKDGRVEWYLDQAIPEEWGAYTTWRYIKEIPIIISGHPDSLNAQITSVRYLPNDKDPEITFERKRNINSSNDLLSLVPSIAANLKSLQPPDYMVLTGADVKHMNKKSLPVFSVDDPKNDDVGNGNFGYPTGPQFHPGIFDLTGFSLMKDHQSYYFKLSFRNLVDPGWHAEYGFQLTFVTIAINSKVENIPATRVVGRNSNWTLVDGHHADRLIHIGGGLEVVDAKGKILAQHIPRELMYPLGNAALGEISFALPRSLFVGEASDWNITVLVGSQDDHGGGGIGEFRNVTENGGIWEGSGGGKGSSNIYDTLYFP